MVNKIFGIGLSRTGTTSLYKALEQLGFNILHNPPLVINDIFYWAESFENVFLNYYKKVKNYFKNRSNDILFINIIEGEGYEKLCSFLKLPILNEEFPHEHKKRIKKIVYI